MEYKQSDFDSIIIGGGHNGLVTATYLARAGQRVLVLERRNHPGGGAVTEELWPDHHFSTCAHLLHRMPPKLFDDFHLVENGVEVIERKMPVFLRHDGTYTGPPEHNSPRNRASVSNLTREQLDQRAAYDQYKEKLITPFVPHRLEPFPEKEAFFQSLDSETRALVEDAEKIRVREIQDQLMPDPRARAPYDLDAMSYGPDPAALCLGMHALSKEYPGHGTPLQGFVAGGMGQITNAFQKEALAAGVEIRLNAECARIIVENHQAVGVTLADGTTISAARVVSNLDPKRTFLRLVEPRWVDSTLQSQLQSMGGNDSCMKFFAILSEIPQWKEWDGDMAYPAEGAMFLNSSRESIRAAYRDVEAGRPPETPAMSFNIPSFKDRSLATGNNQTASVWIFPTPLQLRDQSWDDCREAVMESIIDQINEHAPNFRDSIREARLRTPIDLVRDNAMTDGNIYHAPHTEEYLFWNRPLPALRNYQCPIKNLFLCGSGQHPGGEVTGMPGHNAAHFILKHS